MENLASKVEPFQPGLEYGQVVATEAGRFTVRGAWGLVRAEAAASCLVQPQPGDRVLMVTDREAEAYILSVLKRGRAGRTRLVFDGQVDLKVNGGGFSLAADAGLSLASGDKLDLAADKIAVHADRGQAVIGKISFVAKTLRGRVKRIKMVASSVENTFRRLTQRLQDAFRFVEDQEEIQTGSTRYLVEDTLTMNSKNAVHMAEEIVTINAEQVHLG